MRLFELGLIRAYSVYVCACTSTFFAILLLHFLMAGALGCHAYVWLWMLPEWLSKKYVVCVYSVLPAVNKMSLDRFTCLA
jgi:hypothetical protein